MSDTQKGIQTDSWGQVEWGEKVDRMEWRLLMAPAWRATGASAICGRAVDGADRIHASAVAEGLCPASHGDWTGFTDKGMGARACLMPRG